MIESLARRMQQQGLKIEFVVYARDYGCAIYVVGSVPVMEEYEQLISDVLLTTQSKD